MRPEISAWPNAAFYQGQLINGDNVTSAAYDRFFHDTVPPIAFVNVPGREKKDGDGSAYNGMEVDVAMGIVKAVYKLVKDHRAQTIAAGGVGGVVKVGIITPYAAQQQELTQRAANGHFDASVMEVVCRTVDGFQVRRALFICPSPHSLPHHGRGRVPGGCGPIQPSSSPTYLTLVCRLFQVGGGGWRPEDTAA